MEALPHRALLIPEILSNLLAQQLEAADLASCALVCRQWNALATESLWRENTPDLCIMVSMHLAGTLMKNVSFIRNMKIRCRICHLSAEKYSKYKHKLLTKDNVFESARPVSLDVDFNLTLVDTQLISSIANPNLLSVKFAEGNYGNEILELLEAKSPYLESVECYNRSPERIDGDFALQFLQNMLNLKKIYGILSEVPAQTLQHLAQRGNLESVSLNGIPSPASLQSLISSNTLTPFEALRDLDIACRPITKSGAHNLFYLFPNLRVLRLNVHVNTEDTDVTSALAQCPHLTDVVIMLSLPQLAVTAESLETTNLLKFFTACPNLQHLSIFCFFSRFGSLKRSAAEFRRCLQALPKIRTLVLPLECEISIDVMRALQRYTPHLTSIVMLDSKVNYRDLLLHPDPPVLPGVKRFIVGSLRDPTGPQPLPPAANDGANVAAKTEMMARLLPSVVLFEGSQVPPTNPESGD